VKLKKLRKLFSKEKRVSADNILVQMSFKSVLLELSFELKNHVSFILSVVHFRCLIDPDFAPLVVQLSEIELIRSIDKVQCMYIMLLSSTPPYSQFSVLFLYSLPSVFRIRSS